MINNLIRDFWLISNHWSYPKSVKLRLYMDLCSILIFLANHSLSHKSKRSSRQFRSAIISRSIDCKTLIDDKAFSSPPFMISSLSEQALVSAHSTIIIFHFVFFFTWIMRPSNRAYIASWSKLFIYWMVLIVFWNHVSRSPEDSRIWLFLSDQRFFSNMILITQTIGN